MILSFEEFVLKASTIDELLSGEREIETHSRRDVERSARRLATWCQSSASGDWELFSQRLARDGLDLLKVLTALSATKIAPSSPAPLWASDAIWIDATLRSQYDGCLRRCNTQFPPFIELIEPVAIRAEQIALGTIEESCLSSIDERAIHDLTNGLVSQISELLSDPLFEQFKSRRNDDLIAQINNYEPSRRAYLEFVEYMRQEGFDILFLKYPVMLRLIATTVRNWIAATGEFLLRLSQDEREIRGSLLRDDDLSKVVSIDAGISDLHNQGRSVLVLRFGSGRSIVYKPKSLQPDAAMERLIEKLNSENAPTTLKLAKHLVKPNYGWTEFVEHASCDSLVQFEVFFERLGAWLALLYCLAGADIHQENIIASGDQPIPVDLEMILQGSTSESASGKKSAHDRALDRISDSVSVVGILRAYGVNLDPSTARRAKRFEAPPVWRFANTDRMARERPRIVITQFHLPHVDGLYAAFSEYLDSFEKGFQSYIVFLKRRGILEQDLQSFKGIPVRSVIFPTRLYYGVLSRLRDYRHMADGFEWSSHADFISRLVNWDMSHDKSWPLISAQRHALLELNVPHFTVASDGMSLSDYRGYLLDIGGSTGLTEARRRIKCLNDVEIRWQLEVIEQETSIVAPRKADREGVLIRANETSTIGCDYLAEASNIAQEIISASIRHSGDIAWIGVDRVKDADAVQLVPLGVNLYGGVTGLALFLAAHFRVTGDIRSAETARVVIRGIRQKLESKNAARMGRFLGTGGVTGLGSLVYGIAAISRCLGDPEILKHAMAASRLITEEIIDNDRECSVIDGNAGAILALLFLYKHTGCTELLRQAARCGEGLLKRPRFGDLGRRTWATDPGGRRRLNGLSHGAAGFAYSLTSLAIATGVEEFAVAADECVAFENSNFDYQRSNWPDYSGEIPSWPAQWCHGATGIGLARLASAKLDSVRSAELNLDVTRALRGASAVWPNALDSLCCGSLGTIELLDVAGVALSRPEYSVQARTWLSAVVSSAREAGDYRWNSGARRFNLGLFRGLAGVGYTLLRRIDSSLPNVLILG